GGRAGGRPADGARRQPAQPGQAPGLHHPDPRGGEGALPRAEDQARHAQVRAHLPRLAHRADLQQEQGQDLARAGRQDSLGHPGGCPGRGRRHHRGPGGPGQGGGPHPRARRRRPPLALGRRQG
ncbi:unnamed protein product, partial [Heterosigma akashiwo]